MDEKKRLIKNTGIIAIGNLSTKLVSFLLLPLYTAVLSTSEYGIVDYIVSISMFCVPFVSVLMDESMFRFLIDCKTDKEKSNMISLSIVIILIGCGVFLIVSVPILYLLKFPYAFSLIFYIFMSVLSMMISALLRGIGRTDKYALFNFLTSIANVILNVIFIAVLNLGVRGMLFAYIIAQAGISTVYILKQRLWEYVSFHNLNKEEAKSMIKYSMPLIPNKISWSIINLSDRLIIMNIIGSDASGLYAVAYKFPTFMDTIYGFFYQSWKESSARVLEIEAKEEFYNSIYTYLKGFMYSIVLGMIAFMPLAFYFLVNSTYHEAILYVPILLLGTYFSNISGFYGGIFTAYKDTKIMGTTTILAAIINFFVNIILIRYFGLYAAAISTLVASFVVYVYRKAKVGKYVHLNENMKQRVLSCIVTVVILLCFYSENKLLIGISCGISIIYAVYENIGILKGLISNIRERI